MIVRPLRLPLLALLLVTLVLGMASPGVSATDASAIETTPQLQRLIERYAPILKLKEQSQQCDNNGEPYDAGPVDLVLGHPAVYLRNTGSSGIGNKSGPTADDLEGLGESYFLDLPGDPLRAGCTYEHMSRAQMATLTPTANVHIAGEPGRDGFAIQYWLFYLYNDFNNKHESDWEMVQVVFDVNSVEEALSVEPSEVGYAQHGGGERSDWNDPKFEHEDGHPIVYVSRGSHASQYDSAVYLGWGENGTGFGCDVTLGPSITQPVTPQVVADSTGSQPQEANWLTFTGHWGQRGPWEFDGPRGPNVSSKWSKPLSWQDGLRDGSLAVPLSGALGPTPTKVFCNVSAASSNLFRIWAEQSWLATLYVVLPLAIVVWLLVVSWRSLSAAATLFARNLIAFVPAAAIVVAVGLLTVFLRQIGVWIFQDSATSDTPAAWSVYTFILSLAQQIIGVVLIAPPVIYAVARIHAGQRMAARIHWVAGIDDYRRMVRALLRPTLIISVASVVPFGGIVALYQYILRVFIPQAVLLDDNGPADSRSASASVVQGRWLRTTALVAVLTALVVIPSPIIGIALLVYFGQSVTFVNLASSIVYALVYPFIFVTLTLYYIEHRNPQAETGPPAIDRSM